MLKQVEFLIQGYLLPITMGRLQVSTSFIIEDATSKKGLEGSFAFAFIGVEDEHSFFRRASSKVNLFLLLHALITGQAATYLIGAAIPLSTLDDLGKSRVTFGDYEKLTHLNEVIDSEFSKPILLTKERFLQLEKNMDRILDRHVGLALSYYHRAAQASGRGRVTEAVIDLSIAAETLFSTGENFKKNLKRRLSNFIGDNESERNEISKKIGEFYHLRGLIVHGEKINTGKIRLADVSTASEYIRKAIDKALSSKLYLKAELIQAADKC